MLLNRRIPGEAVGYPPRKAGTLPLSIGKEVQNLAKRDKTAPRRPLDGQKDDAEFAFDLTPDVQDGGHTAQHKRRPEGMDGGRMHQVRSDDQPHLGRKGGEF